MQNLKESKLLDLNSEYFGVSLETLMENAGKSVAGVITENFDIHKKKICVVAGFGGNGGDGLVAARYLSQYSNVSVTFPDDHKNIKSEHTLKNFKRLSGVQISYGIDHIKKCVEESDLIIDAIFGIGILGTIKEPYFTIITIINDSKKPVISIDIPSGLGTNCAVKPTMTVTLNDLKEGMTERNSGRIVIKDIGIPHKVYNYVGPGYFVYYDIPKQDSHKGDNGVVLVVGGGPYTGAPAFCGLGAYRIGADLVYITTSSKIYSVVATYSPSFIVFDYFKEHLNDQAVENIVALSNKCTSVAIGPGLGYNEEISNAVLKLIKYIQKPMVIDADAIKAIATDKSVLNGKSVVITPHKGEFLRLTETEPIEENIKNFAKKYNITMLLKGRIDIITDGHRLKNNSTGNPGMTVGGTGDVLTGIVAGLLAKGMAPFEAACLGAFVNGAAGDLAFEKKSYGLLPEDILLEIPEILKKYISLL